MAELLRCSFCGKNKDAVKKLIAGPNVQICDECTKMCSGMLEVEATVSPESSSEKLPTPIELHKALDEYVIGQEYAKKILSVSGSVSIMFNKI